MTEVFDWNFHEAEFPPTPTLIRKSKLLAAFEDPATLALVETMLDTPRSMMSKETGLLAEALSEKYKISKQEALGAIYSRVDVRIGEIQMEGIQRRGQA